MRLLALSGWGGRLLLALLAAASSCSTQAADEWQIGRGRWSGSLGMNYLQSRYASDSDLGNGSTGSTQILQERLEMQGIGLYVLDPRLVSLDLGLSLSHNQSNFSSLVGASSTESDSTNSFLGYSLNADIFSSKPYPVKLFATSLKNQTSQGFGGLTVDSYNREGFSLELKEDSVLKDWVGPWFRARLSAEQQHNQTSTNFFGRVNRSESTSRSLLISANKGFSSSDLQFSYQANERRNALIEEAALVSQGVSLLHGVDFGPGLNRSLSSSLYYGTVQAQEPFNTLSVSEALHIDHFQNLSTDTNYNYLRDEARGVVIVSQDGSFAISHKLYQNLSTSIRLHGGQSSLPAGSRTYYGGSLGQSYTHALPRGGNLGVNWSGGYQRNSNALSSGTIPVTREPHPAPAEFALGFRLAKPFVNVESIQLFNVTSGIRELIPRSAYALQQEANFVRITPRYLDINDADPLIKPDDKLEVDYTYQVDARLENESRNLGYGFTVSYGWIGGGYQHQQTQQNPLAGEAIFLLSTRDDVVNLRLGGVWLGWPVTLQTSHSRSISSGVLGQRQEDTTRMDVQASGRALGMDASGHAGMVRYREQKVAYDQLLIAATLLWLPASTNWNMSFSANASTTANQQPVEVKSTDLSARGALNWDPSGGWRHTAFVEVTSNYYTSKTSSTSSSRRTALRLGGRTAFTVGKLALSSGVYFNQLISGGANFSSQAFDISVTRAF